MRTSATKQGPRNEAEYEYLANGVRNRSKTSKIIFISVDQAQASINFGTILVFLTRNWTKKIERSKATLDLDQEF